MCLTLQHGYQRRAKDPASFNSVQKSQRGDERLDRVPCSHRGERAGKTEEKGGE